MLKVNNPEQSGLLINPALFKWFSRWREHGPLTVFVFSSMLIQMSIGQEDSVSPENFKYWILIIPALLLPFLNLTQTLNVFLSRRGVWLLAFGILACAWHLIRADNSAVTQVILFVWITAWVGRRGSALKIQSLANLYIALLAIGACIFYYTDMNVWGLLPSNTREDYGIWRVSFFPNIANTGILSLFMLLLLTRDKETARSHPILLLICLYFLVFSFVRTAQIAAFAYVGMRIWFYFLRGKFLEEKTFLFFSAIFAAVLIHVFIATAPLLLEYLQSFPIISRLFLRGAEGLSTQEIFQQAYRPWLWLQHAYLFISSPSFMGLGTFEFDQLIEYSLLPEHINTGSESLPTRLLASFGIPFLLFMVFILGNLSKRAKAKDHWACACFPTIILLMMNWGSVFHPTNAFFVFFFLILIHGSSGFLGKYDLSR
jgi:hypothetical protein